MKEQKLTYQVTYCDRDFTIYSLTFDDLDELIEHINAKHQNVSGHTLISVISYQA